MSEAGIRISMDGRGRCMDNILIERLWRALKQEAVYLEDLTDSTKPFTSSGTGWNTITPIVHTQLLSTEQRKRHIGQIRIDNWRHENQSGYALNLPPTCPVNQDHFSSVGRFQKSQQKLQ